MHSVGVIKVGQLFSESVQLFHDSAAFIKLLFPSSIRVACLNTTWLVLMSEVRISNQTCSPKQPYISYVVLERIGKLKRRPFELIFSKSELF